MSAPKVAVYMICKDEQAFMRRCYESVMDQEPESFVIVDTGSSDHTVGMLRDFCLTEKGMQVLEAHVSPWRFDDARNLALAAVPEDIDICISLDADEVLEPGFIEAVKKAWKPGPGPIRMNHSFRTIWDWEGAGDSVSNHFHERIHSRFGYRWIHPVHEKLVANEPDTVLWCTEALMTQRPDRGKSRSSYYPLLEQATVEDPTDWKLWAFLAEEQERAGDSRAAVLSYEKAAVQPGADTLWLLLQRAMTYERMGNIGAAKSCYAGGMLMENVPREFFCYAGDFYCRREEYSLAKHAYEEALNITAETHGYMRNSNCWDGTIENKLKSLNNQERDE